MRRSVAVWRLGLALMVPGLAQAWGDEGHEIVALIAQSYLEAPVRSRVQVLLAGDRSALVADSSMASEAVWADRYRDSDREGGRRRYRQTQRWHFVDLELRAPDLTRACYGRRPLPSGVAAADGPARACVVDKIEQFEAELRRPATSPEERRLALQFLLHLIGDLHQPLHAADDEDAGGNRKRVFARGFAAGSLHQYWDTQFVQALGRDPRQVADALRARIGAAELTAWRRGGPADWARESFSLAQAHAYGALPAPVGNERYRLPAGYVDQALDVVSLQLQRAGVRLALVLNRALR